MSQQCLTLPEEITTTLLLENNQQVPFNINDTIKYKCSAGYVFTDSSIKKTENYPVFTCKLKNNVAIWDFDASACRPVSCGYPGYVENAKMEGLEYFFPKVVSYECNEGYKNNKLLKTWCQSTGVWWPPTTEFLCTPIVCPNLSVPLNGSIHYSNGNNYDSTATYSCDKGYVLKGNKTRTCTNSGMWDGSEPTCQKVTCPKPIRTASQDSYDVGHVFAFKCPQTKKEFSTKCKEDGQWSTKIICISDSNNVNSNNSTNANNKTNTINNVSLSNNVNPNGNTNLNNIVNPSSTTNKNANINLNNMASLSNNTISKNNLLSNNNVNSNNNAGNSTNNKNSNKSIIPVNNIIQQLKQNILKNKFIIFIIICLIMIFLLVIRKILNR